MDISWSAYFDELVKLARTEAESLESLIRKYDMLNDRIRHPGTPAAEVETAKRVAEGVKTRISGMAGSAGDPGVRSQAGDWTKSWAQGKPPSWERHIPKPQEPFWSSADQATRQRAQARARARAAGFGGFGDDWTKATGQAARRAGRRAAWHSAATIGIPLLFLGGLHAAEYWAKKRKRGRKRKRRGS